MDDHFEISFDADGKRFAGTVYPDRIDEQLLFQLHYHAEGEADAAVVFIEKSKADGEDWVQRIAMGEQPFLSPGFVQAAGAAISAQPEIDGN